MSQNQNSLGKKIYNTTAEVGQISSTVGAGVGTLFGVAMIIGGIVMLTRKSKPNPDFPDDPDDGSFNKTGWIFIGFGILVIITVWVYYYMVHRYKGLAAVEGVSTGISGIKDLIQQF